MSDDRCSICFNPPPLFASESYPNEMICDGCKSYEDYWDSLTPAEQREEHELANRHCEETS